MRRIKCDRAVWHVFCRGARRLNLFHEEGDFLKFLSVLKQALEGSGCELYAWVLMSNHFHLMLRADSACLSRLMQRVDYAYSRYHNTKYALSGHAFDGPYQAYPQGTAVSILYKIAYVFLNPVTAGLTSHPAGYRWSGFSSFMGHSRSPLPVEAGHILTRLSADPGEARRKFLQILEREKRLLRRKSPAGPGREEILTRQFESLNDYAESIGEIGGLPSNEVALYWGARAGVPLRVIARVFGETPERLKNRRHRLLERIQLNPELVKVLELPAA